MAEDGTASTFSIPSGQVLVVTSIDWGRCVGSGAANNLVSLTPYSAGPGAGAVFAYLFGIAGANGCAGGTTAITGVAVKSGRTVCVPSDSNQEALHGYLTKDK
ncbi:MAG: hypothetical protein ACHQ4J_01715 [Candidatus Binatia bacterium]